jgi:hypothetical protein
MIPKVIQLSKSNPYRKMVILISKPHSAFYIYMYQKTKLKSMKRETVKSTINAKRHGAETETEQNSYIHHHSKT